MSKFIEIMALKDFCIKKQKKSQVLHACLFIKRARKRSGGQETSNEIARKRQDRIMGTFLLQLSVRHSSQKRFYQSAAIASRPRDHFWPSALNRISQRAVVFWTPADKAVCADNKMSWGGWGIISTILAPLGQLLTEKINVKHKGSKKINIKKVSHTLNVFVLLTVKFLL